MYISIEQLRESIDNLASVHPFYGTTFLVCKLADIPVGDRTQLPISDLENDFLERYYKPNPSSDYFYRVFRVSGKSQHWIHRAKYASSTLQTIRTRGPFAKPFDHPINTNSWGWKPDYVNTLWSNLAQNSPPYKGEPVPAFHLAVWLFRERRWSPDTTALDIIDAFLNEFKVSDKERTIFDLNVPAGLYTTPLLQRRVALWEDLREIIGSPPDAEPEEGGTLALLEIQGVGPSRKLSFEPAERLSLVTGDNGLGKTFLLECSWWALTNQWTDKSTQASPRQDAQPNEPKITFQIAGERSNAEKVTINYDWKTQSWPSPKKRPTIPGLVVYARVDGSFAVWDPARNNLTAPERGDSYSQQFSVFTREQVWDGYGGQIEGLLRDWVRWQSRPDKHPFEVFKRVLRRLSPPDMGLLEPGEPRRLPFDSREIPTLRHRYGEVPIIHASAGVRRIVTLAYLIVWAWNEHEIQSRLARVEPQRRMVVLVDEMEAHLHPLWQRSVLPSLLDVGEELSNDLRAQFLVATHSPLVMASVESVFDQDTDKLFHVDLSLNGEVSFRELRFIRYGSVDAWLTSDVFDLRHARSLEAESALERAKALQHEPQPSEEEVREVSEQLIRSLASDDRFWPRWVYFAEQHGVEL